MLHITIWGSEPGVCEGSYSKHTRYTCQGANVFRRTTLEACKVGRGPHGNNHSVTYIKFRNIRPGTPEPPSLATSREEQASNNACEMTCNF